MLVLTRKINQSIVIGDNVRITLTSIHGRQVRLAIEAPREVVVLRKELDSRERPGPKPVAPRHRLRPGANGRGQLPADGTPQA